MNPPVDLTMWEWAEQSVVLSPRQPTAFPGLYRSSLNPYVRGVYDALKDPHTQTITVMKGAQTGLTLVAYVAVCYWIVQDPAPVLIVMPNEGLARSASENRIQPMIEDSPVIAAELMRDPDAFKKLEYRTKRAVVNLVGSNSAAQLASRPVRYLILDEVDKYPQEQVKEASAASLAIQRTKTYFNRKILEISTPTTTGGYINTQYESSDKRLYFLPCKACGVMQPLKWAQVKYNSNAETKIAAAGSYYECEKCGAKWTDQDKVAALARGEWRATGAAIMQGHAGFHISSLYAPWVRWSDLVGKWLKVKDSPTELRDFVNSDLGEPWVEEVERMEDESIAGRCAEYKKGELLSTVESYAPVYKDKERCVIVTCDVQKTYLVAVAREWFDGGDSALIDWAFVPGFDELEIFCKKHNPAYVGVDYGYATRAFEVFEYSLNYRAVPLKGADNISVPLRKVVLDPYEGKAGQGQSRLPTYTFASDTFKSLLMDMMRGESGKTWMVYRHIEAEYVKQVTAEERVSGEWRLRRGHTQNHLFDCEVMQLVMATAGGLYRTTWLQTDAKDS